MTFKLVCISLILGLLWFNFFFKCPKSEVQNDANILSYRENEFPENLEEYNQIEIIYAKLLMAQFKQWGKPEDFVYNRIDYELNSLNNNFKNLNYYDKICLTFAILSFFHLNVNEIELLARNLGKDYDNIKKELQKLVDNNRFSTFFITEYSIKNFNSFFDSDNNKQNDLLEQQMNVAKLELSLNQELLYSKILFFQLHKSGLFGTENSGLLLDEAVFHMVKEIYKLKPMIKLYLYLILVTCPVDAGAAYVLYDTLGALEYQSIVESIDSIPDKVYKENFMLNLAQIKNLRSFCEINDP